MLVDLCVGLENKDGSLVDPEALIKALKGAGLDGAVLTRDGNVAPDVAPYREAADKEGLTVFAGARLATNHGLILAIMPNGAGDEGWPKAEDGHWDAHGVIDAVDAAGGAAVALRPYDRDVAKPMGDHLFSLHGLAACEVPSGGLSEIAADLALEAASNLDLPCVGSSNAAGAEGLGSVATLFRSAAKSEAELIELLRKGECWPVTFTTDVPRGDGDRRPNNRGRRDDRGPRRDDRGPRRDGRGRNDRDRGRGGRGRGGPPRDGQGPRRNDRGPRPDGPPRDQAPRDQAPRDQAPREHAPRRGVPVSPPPRRRLRRGLIRYCFSTR